MKSLDLASAMEYVGRRYSFTSDHYPVIKHLSSEQRKAFAISHSIHHMCKSVGRIAAQCEAFDHGGALNEEVLKDAAVKMMIDALKLAEELGMSAAEVAEKMPMLMKNKSAI